MIRILVKQMLDDKNFKEGKRTTLAELCEVTGISKTTMNKIVNEPGYNVGLNSIDELCRYFSCQPGELLKFIEE
ncbi:helix-turn-helix domain-containing protein [Endozoicomonas ascidiicola]|uniref:helix-turn-helix domain-containing protein n=1 Tax=Endozoicomonas ascidiicola TaxID=1698521 RepID=UPI00082FFEF5|nr:helix-turn-helix transcriptional regulator [Endozoicomonas ascidiicola]